MSEGCYAMPGDVMTANLVSPKALGRRGVLQISIVPIAGSAVPHEVVTTI